MTMKSYASNHSEYRRSAAANRFAEEQSGKVTTQKFTDNRASAVAQRQLTSAINNSPKQAIQRQRLNSQFANAVPLKSSGNEALKMNAALGVSQRTEEEYKATQASFSSEASQQRQIQATAQLNKPSLSPMKNIPDSNIVQRVIDVNGEVFDNKSQTSDVVGKIMSTLGKPKGEVAKYSGRIADMIGEGGKIPFPSYQKLYDHLAPVLPPMESQYEGQVAPPSSAITESSIVLFRAMSEAEGAALGSSSQFAMYVGKNHQESGIKFFATDINYSIRLSNKKNEEAYAKQEKELPYTHMVGAVVDKDEVEFGLEEDIGVHNDTGHTEGFLRDREEVVEGDLTAHSEEGFKQIAHGQGHAVDTSDRGYVLKHEKGGLNFGVKAKTEENTKPHWRSPIDYFNSLVKWARFIGRFVMRAPE